MLAKFRTALRPSGHLAIADLDHFVGHHGFDRDALASELIKADFTHPTSTTVSTITNHTDNETADFNIFLAICSVA